MRRHLPDLPVCLLLFLETALFGSRGGVSGAEQRADDGGGDDVGSGAHQALNAAAAARDGEQALADAGGQPEPAGALSKVGMKLGLEGETLLDRSDAHIAEIVIQGAAMGVIEMTKALNTYDAADPHARGLASQFVVQQNEAIDRQKTFLQN